MITCLICNGRQSTIDLIFGECNNENNSQLSPASATHFASQLDDAYRIAFLEHVVHAASFSDSVAQLYSHHHGWLVSLLRSKLGNIDNANDLAQDTFTRILTARDADEIREPRAYLTTIASRLTAQYFRRLALERAYLDALAGMPEETTPSPETRMLVIEALTAVSRVLDGLSPRVREIFLLSQLDGLTYADIASQFDMSVNAVQKSMIRAFQHCYAAVYAPQ